MLERKLKTTKELRGATEQGNLLELDGKLYSPYKGRYARAYRPSEMLEELKEIELVETYVDGRNNDQWLSQERNDYCIAVMTAGIPLSQADRKKFDIDAPCAKRIEAKGSVITIPSAPDVLHLIAICAEQITICFDGTLTSYINENDIWVAK